MNERIRIDFTHKPGSDKAGKRDSDIMGDKAQACAYARLLNELGYPIHEVTDVYKNQPIDWQKDETRP